MSLTLNLKLDWKAALPVVDFYRRMLFSMEKLLFVVDQHWCRAIFFQKLASSNYKNYWSHAGQVKWKVNCAKLSLEVNSIRIAAHKKSLALKHGQIHAEKWIPPLRGLFNKSPREGHGKREILALKNRQWWTIKLFKSKSNSRYQHCRWFYVG